MNHRGYPVARPRVLEAPTPDDEFRALAALRGGRLYSGGAILLADVFEFAHVQLFNPPESIVELVVEELLVASPFDAAIEVRTTTTPLATFDSFWRQRDQGHQTGRGELRTEARATALGNTQELLSGLIDGAGPLPGHSYVLFPGEGLIVAATVAQVQILATYLGRERLLDPFGRR